MANMRNISRLFATEPDRAPVKLPKFGNSQIDVPEPSLLDLQNMFWQQPARRRFGSSGRLTAPPMSNSVTPASIPTGRATFGDVAVREIAQQMRATAMRRYSQQPRGGGADHHAGVRIHF